MATDQGDAAALVVITRNLYVGTEFPGVTLVDYDILLVDQSRVTLGATTAQNFRENWGKSRRRRVWCGGG